jgi:hypothetical protein
MEEELKRVKLPNIKIALTGGGRVANGAIEILSALRIRNNLYRHLLSLECLQRSRYKHFN